MNERAPFSPPGGSDLPPDVRRSLAGLPDHEREALVQAWRLAGDAALPAPSPEDARQAAAGMRRRFATDRRPRRRSTVRGWPWVVGGVVLAAVVAGYFMPVTQEAAPGTPTTIVLTDGSTVELNGGAAVRYRRGLWGSVRRVTLEGEAFFDVVASGRLFRVETFNAQVDVLGTRFGVRARPEGTRAGTTVLLTEGRVRLAAGDGRAAVELEPGTSSRVPLGGTPTLPVSFNADVEFIWRSGGLAFVDHTLPEILDGLEAWFGTDIRLAEPPAADERLTWILPEPGSLDAALAALCTYAGCRFERTVDGVLVTPAP